MKLYFHEKDLTTTNPDNALLSFLLSPQRSILPSGSTPPAHTHINITLDASTSYIIDARYEDANLHTLYNGLRALLLIKRKDVHISFEFKVKDSYEYVYVLHAVVPVVYELRSAGFANVGVSKEGEGVEDDGWVVIEKLNGGEWETSLERMRGVVGGIEKVSF